MDIQHFQEIVWDYYRSNKRDLPWRREPFTAYNILVSEVMLQQTQVKRVEPKYWAFLHDFPKCQDLANTSLAEVLKHWSGLGYNRRAKYLHDAAKQLASTSEPWTIDDLIACKGIGYNTAAAVVTYAYDKPCIFIETNIRTVYIHHFFENETEVTDKQLLPIIEKAVDKEHPREWYWALMDYGSFLKTRVGNASKYSKHYAKQSKFEGSLRQVRGSILRELTQGSMDIITLRSRVADDRCQIALEQLVSEGLVQQHANRYALAE